MTTTNGGGKADGARKGGLMRWFVNNLLMMPRDSFRRMFDPRRDIEAECGHPRYSESIGQDEYTHLWERDAIARRVVRVLPKESWQVQPSVYESGDPEVKTPFEKAWAELGTSLRGGDSYHAEEQGSPVWEALKRADEVSGIGHYGVIFLGLDDGARLDTPAAMTLRSDVNRRPAPPALVPQQGAGNSRKLLFLTCLPEQMAEVSQYEANTTSPRFGQPLFYNITLTDPRELNTGVGMTPTTRRVHWTRVVHVADNTSTSPVIGAPRMRAVFNRLVDLRKLYGGSAEMYWRGAFPGISAETHPSMGGDVDMNDEEIRDMMEDYMNGLQRYLLSAGLNMKSLAPQVVDPRSQIDVQLDAICIELGCPKRVFLGSERGELASSQDDAAWNDRLKERQETYLTPRLIAPFVDRLIHLGVLPPPERFYVSWPDLTSQTTQEKSQVAFQRTQALVQYINSVAPVVFPPLDYLTRILGLSEDDAMAVLASAEKAGYVPAGFVKAKMESLKPKAQAAPGNTVGGPTPDRRTARNRPVEA